MAGAVLTPLLCVCALHLLTAAESPTPAAEPASDAVRAAPLRMTIAVDRPGAKINPGFYGLMTEEINHAYDGGLYGELVQNRSFKDSPDEPVHWSVVQEAGGQGTIALDRSNPLNPAQEVSLRLEIGSGGGRVGVANDGFWGIPVRPDTAYRASFYARGAGSPGPLTVALESSDGRTVFARAEVAAPGPEWKKYAVTLKTQPGVMPSTANRLVISATQPGTVWLSFVSLFPPTYKNRPNGNRIDLMEKLAAMQPSFLRFPGGNYLDPGHYEWKKTIGPVEQRPGSPGAWKYHVSEGLGLLEFFLWCEDLHMEPLLAVSDGRSWLPADGDVSPLVQDALDEIEYATGGSDTTWGARRAADGHPAPFQLRYVEVGNEDGYAKPVEVYDRRFARFFDAIRARYPSLQIISTWNRLKSRTPDLVDDHLYKSAAAMLHAASSYDGRSRQGPKVLVGEWATNGDGSPTATLRAALADAAYLTGLERNADLVQMACYAPLLVNVNPGARQWRTNLIGYDALTSFGSPSYYVQCMFNRHRGDTVLPVSLGDQPSVYASASRDASSGDVILKVVNPEAAPRQVDILLEGVPGIESTARGEWLTGQPDFVNSVAEPTKVAPQPLTITDAGKQFTHVFPACSVSVVRLKPSEARQ